MKNLKIALVAEQDYYIGTKEELNSLGTNFEGRRFPLIESDIVIMDIKQEELVGFIIGITSCGTSLYDCNIVNITRDLDIAGIRRLVRKLSK